MKHFCRILWWIEDSSEKNSIHLKQKYYKSLPVLFDQFNECLLNQTINFFKINYLLISYCYIFTIYIWKVQVSYHCFYSLPCVVFTWLHVAYKWWWVILSMSCCTCIKRICNADDRSGFSSMVSRSILFTLLFNSLSSRSSMSRSSKVFSLVFLADRISLVFLAHCEIRAIV